MRLVRFGDWRFPPQAEFSTNFGEVVLKAVRLPGRDGGFDAYGEQRGPSEVGNVRTSFWLKADTPAELRGLVDEVYQQISYGTKRLWLDPANGGAQRYTNAKVNNIQVPENVRDRPHKRVRVRMSFQCVEPYWLRTGSSTPTWGGGFVWGGGAAWGGSTPTYSASGTSTDISITNNGTAPTQARITLTVGAGDSADNVTIRRVVSGATVDEVAYAGTLSAGDVLDIRGRQASVKLNGAAAYADFTFTRGHWVLLEPGENTLRVVMDNAGDAIDTIKVRFVERYY